MLSTLKNATTRFSSRPISTPMILLVALMVHGPLLLMQLPAGSFDANFHIFFASHYAHHWFSPWNEKWFAGFSQTTYPPLTHQWIALLSTVTGLNIAYGLVQLAALVLLPVGVFRFGKLWVDDRSAAYAAIASIFLGAVAFMVYQAGQLATVAATALYLNGPPYFYDWSRFCQWRGLFKGLAMSLAAAAAHHVSLIFGLFFFALPVLALALSDAHNDETKKNTVAVAFRAALFAILGLAGVGLVLLPYWIALLKHPVHQIPIPHDSRNNLLLNFITGINYFVIPYGALILALPFIIMRGMATRRLRPLVLGFWLAFIFGLGGTTPLPRCRLGGGTRVGRWLLGGAFEVLTFERFTFWATILAMPIAGLLFTKLLDRYGGKALAGLAVASTVTLGAALAWTTNNPYRPASVLDVKPVISFLNRDGPDNYRYMTLGFASALARVSTYSNAGSVDGDYNSARLLPEMTRHGSAQLTNAKFYGTPGMDSLPAIPNPAHPSELKSIFFH